MVSLSLLVSSNKPYNGIIHSYCKGLLLNANWSIVSDMTLYIVIPTRRGVATATQILVHEALF